MANIASSSSAATFEVDASVWRALVGSSVQIPPINSHVYYFPEGHLEHTSPSSSSAAANFNYNFTLSRPFIPCQVLSVRFLSDPSSDRPFVKMLLHPSVPRPCHNDHIINIDDAETENDIVSFAKALTPSDANNGGGFSVPKFCAEMVFPPLGSAGAPGRPPSQDMIVKDATRDHAWRFRHIYRGTPRRHLVSTGWTRFVKSKRLVTGDTVVFMRKKSTEELFVGVRRAQLSVARSYGDGCGCGCRRHSEALEAIRRAAAGMEFEVVYYPEYGLPDFVVRTKKVRDALEMKWRAGMRVRTAMDGDDLSRVAWFQGTVEATSSRTWFGSPWRMLQVNWDEPEILDSRMCPWQVEQIPLIQTYLAPPPPKKLKAQPNIPGILLMMAAKEDAKAAHHGSPGQQYDPNNNNNSVGLPFLGGRDGARPGDTRTIGQTSRGPQKNDDPPGSTAVSTFLSIGSSSVHVAGSQHGYGSGGYSFRLFGKNIVGMLEPGGGGGGGTKCCASCTCGRVD